VRVSCINWSSSPWNCSATHRESCHAISRAQIRFPMQGEEESSASVFSTAASSAITFSAIDSAYCRLWLISAFSTFVVCCFSCAACYVCVCSRFFAVGFPANPSSPAGILLPTLVGFQLGCAHWHFQRCPSATIPISSLGYRGGRTAFSRGAGCGAGATGDGTADDAHGIAAQPTDARTSLLIHEGRLCGTSQRFVAIESAGSHFDRTWEVILCRRVGARRFVAAHFVFVLHVLLFDTSSLASLSGYIFRKGTGSSCWRASTCH
jgi:hypothetical protein